MRFADLGLLGERPDLIVSGINHGSNLGDDVTYSGTVAAAFEGIVLGIPAIAVSQQAGVGGMGYAGREFDFTYSAAVAREVVRRVIDEPLSPSTLININCPAGEPRGIEITRLGKRLYDDELKLVEEDDGSRRRYKIYGFEPSFEDEDGTDLNAVAARPGRDHADPLRPHRPRRARAARASGTSRRSAPGSGSPPR